MTRVAPIAAALALALGAGCATDPAKHLADSGQALLVDVNRHSYQYTAKEKVGEVEQRDASGALVGTSTVTRDVVRTAVDTTWTLKQGDQVLDEEDFFAIAGDSATAQQITDGRKFGELLQNVGGGVFFGGLGVLATGLVITNFPHTGSQNDTLIVAGSTVTGIGLLAALAGGYSYYLGHDDLDENKHWTEVDKATAAANAFNARRSSNVAKAEPAPVVAAPAVTDASAPVVDKSAKSAGSSKSGGKGGSKAKGKSKG